MSLRVWLAVPFLFSFAVFGLMGSAGLITASWTTVPLSPVVCGAGVAVGTVGLVLAVQKKDEIDHNDNCNSSACGPSQQGLVDSYDSRRNLSTVGFVAGTALLAVGVLFWVSFWLIQRLDHRRWMEFLKARVWKAVSVGSSASLVALGFTAVYREGFETALFYQALLSFGEGLLPWVLAGLGTGLVALVVVAYGIFRMGRRMAVGQFLKVAVIAVMTEVP